MSLYSTFTLKEWLSLNCVTKDIDKLFRKALRDNDEPMTVLAMNELIKRDDVDLVIDAIAEAVDEEYLVPETSFSTVLANALIRLGDRKPALRRISKKIHLEGRWPKTAAELLEGSVLANCERVADGRLDQFLGSFMRNGHFSIELGIFTPGTEWDPHCKETISVNAGEHCVLVIKNGFILNPEEIPGVLDVLDEAGIVGALPEFSGVELDYYVLDENNNWANTREVEDLGDNFFYVSYYSLG